MAVLTIEDVQGAVNELRRDMQAQIAELRSEIEDLRARQSGAGGPDPVTRGTVTEGVSPDTLAIMAAVVTAYLGKRVRIRSARHVPAPEPFNPWAQHGRNMGSGLHRRSFGR